MKKIVFSVLGTLLILGIFISLYSCEKKVHVKSSNVELQSLAEIATGHPNLREFLIHASTTVYTELTIIPLKPEGLKDKDADGSPSQELIEWHSKNAKTISLHQMDKVIKTLNNIKKGSIVLADPNDNPLRYDRAHLHLQYEEDKITQASVRSL